MKSALEERQQAAAASAKQCTAVLVLREYVYACMHACVLFVC